MILVMHPNQLYALRRDPTFEPVASYAEFLSPLHGEIGRCVVEPFGYVRVILSEHPKARAVG